MASVRTLVEAVSETLFPGLHIAYDKSRGIARKHGEELLTSLPLQVLVYFNIFYSPLWLTSRCLCLYVKCRYLSLTQQTICVATLVMMTAVEPPRLFLGYTGNVGQEMPALAGFWLLGLLLQLPLLAFAAFAGALPLPLERAVDAPMALFLVAQLAAAFGAVRRVTRQPSSRGSRLVPAAGASPPSEEG
ncbi:transmembrane protein 17-like [Haemaphysalis longicornis]